MLTIRNFLNGDVVDILLIDDDILIRIIDNKDN